MTSSERQAWLEERRTGIGATDIVALVGLGYKDNDALKVYRTKVEPVDDGPRPLLLSIGLATEPLNAAEYERRSGSKLIKSSGVARHPDHDFCFASRDYLEDPSGRAVELKYVRFFDESWGDQETDQVPTAHIIQGQWQMHCSGTSPLTLSAIDGGGQHRIYRIEKSDRIISLLMNVAESFWRGHVLPRREPPADWGRTLAEEVESLVEEVHPDTSIELDVDALALVDEYEAAKGNEKLYAEHAKKLKEEIRELLRGNEVGTLPDGRRVSQKVQHRGSFTVEATSFPTFKILKPRRKS